MKEEAQKTLGDLYAIRATMSLIAQNDDAASPDRNAIDGIRGEIDKCKKASQDKENEMRSNLNDYELSTRIWQLAEERKKAEKELNHQQEEADKYTNKLKNKEYIDRGEKIAFIVLAAIGVILGAIALAVQLPLEMEQPSPIDAGLICALFFPLTFGLLFIGSCIMLPFSIGEYRDYKRWLKQSQVKVQKYQAELDEIDHNLGSLRKRKEEGERYVEDAAVTDGLQELQTALENNDREIARLTETIVPHDEAIQAIAVQSQALIESAMKAYPVIDFRDWGNVDLLIYYYETGRADDMKEALQLVDRQRQTDQITSALAMASAEISRSIHQSMTRLGSALAQSFSVLSSQLAAQHSEMMQGMEEQAERQRAELGRQTALQASAQEMNAALLNKISVSSGRLAEQMDRQMKEVYNIY